MFFSGTLQDLRVISRVILIQPLNTLGLTTNLTGLILTSRADMVI